jgi:hypothetical protein
VNNTDNELFELCDKVYTAFPNWQGLDIPFCPNTFNTANGKVKLNAGHVDDIPLYTSDYLLEKLPPALFIYASKESMKIVNLLEVCMQGDGRAYARYVIPYDTEFRGSYQNKGDTPLKALLKLTLALHKAGEL